MAKRPPLQRHRRQPHYIQANHRSLFLVRSRRPRSQGRIRVAATIERLRATKSPPAPGNPCLVGFRTPRWRAEPAPDVAGSGPRVPSTILFSR